MILKINNIRNILSGIIMLGFLFQNLLNAQSTFGTEQIISSEKKRKAFEIYAEGHSAPFLINSKEWPGVSRAFRDLRTDIGKVTASLPELVTDKLPDSKEIIVAGTIGKSDLIDRLVKAGKIDAGRIAGKWETFSIQIVKRPFKGIKRALVITGSDKRGTIYGIYDLSRQIGVSPWYWWADVPVGRKTGLYAAPSVYIEGPPSVKYMGIFLNDEAPDLTNWIRAKYGYVAVSDDPPVPPGVANYGREFYTRLFELMLRLKANYLWPAMWNNAFNEDDPENPRLADEYGIVMGNSHQEPMLRAQKEWDRRHRKKLGNWNYAKYPDIMEAFWREGTRRNSKYESIITIGLRGADDTPMSPEGPEANMK
ncbi:MAG: glycosyl hydrolase, partial [Bacteroidia bacterium]